MKVNILSRLAIVSKLNAKKYKDEILDELGLGNNYFENIQEKVKERMDKTNNGDPKDCWANYVTWNILTGSRESLKMMKEGYLIDSEKIAKYKDKESISRGLNEIKIFRKAWNEKKRVAKQKLKEFDDFVKDLRNEIEESIKAKEAHIEEREEYLNDCENHIKNFR